MLEGEHSKLASEHVSLRASVESVNTTAQERLDAYKQQAEHKWVSHGDQLKFEFQEANK